MRKELSIILLFLLLVVSRAQISHAAVLQDADVLMVTSNRDSGPGTLRQALVDARPGSVIHFSTQAFPKDSPAVIEVLSGLPGLETGGVTIDASGAGVILDGSRLERGTGLAGLYIPSSNNIIMGLQVLNFPGSGIILVDGAQNNIIGGSEPGQGNVLSGNWDGINIVGQGTSGNRVIGNFIGTDASGMYPLGNLVDGIWVGNGAVDNIIGGKFGVGGNLISANGSSGIILENTSGNVVTGNLIGMNANESQALGNAATGIGINFTASSNIIGGLEAGEGNVIAAQGGTGISLNGSQVTANIIAGNIIGGDSSGELDFGNLVGVMIMEGANGNHIGSGNRIAFNRRDGILVTGAGSVNNTITGNSIYANARSAILINLVSDQELAAPLLEHADSRRVSGRAGPGDLIDICSDKLEECELIEGTTTADSQGFFKFVVPAGTFRLPHVTAYARDAAGNTSQLTEFWDVAPPAALKELPGVIAPSQVSTQPTVVGTNLGLALFSVVYFGFATTIFNDILKNKRREIGGFFKKVLPGWLRKGDFRVPAQKFLSPWRLLILWGILILLNALVESFLDGELELLDPGRIPVVLTLLAAGLAISGLEWLSDRFAHRRLARAAVSRVEIHWAGLLFALLSVLFSRLMHFTPGYLLGMLGAVYMFPELTGKEDPGRRAAMVMASVFLGGLIFWLVSAVLPPGLAWLEPIFLTIFLIALQGVLFELLPLEFLDGGDLWQWKKGLWAALFAVVFFCFYHFVLNPNTSDVQALQQNGVRALLVVMGVYGLAALALWLGFGRRREAG